MNQETDELYRQKVQKNNSLVTVFMMTHNRVKYLKLAIDSVLRQSYTNFILWIIDNASTDNTKELVSGINDSRVIYSYKDENPFDNMNFAKDVCITPYYIILHDDDIVMDSYLEEALCTIKKYKVDELSVGAYYIDGAGELLQQQNTFSNSIHMYKNDDYFNYFFLMKQNRNYTGGPLVFPSIIYRNAFYKETRFHYTSEAGPAGDVIVHLFTEKNGGTIGYLSKPLIYYRIHAAQDSNTNAGFMELKLIDYLYKDDYFREKFEKMQNALCKRVWNATKKVAVLYYKGAINKRRYCEVFSFECVEKLKRFAIGKCLYSFISFMYLFRWFFKQAYCLKKG